MKFKDKANGKSISSSEKIKRQYSCFSTLKSTNLLPQTPFQTNFCQPSAHRPLDSDTTPSVSWLWGRSREVKADFSLARWARFRQQKPSFFKTALFSNTPPTCWRGCWRSWQALSSVQKDGQYQEAVKYFQESLTYYPENAEIWARMADMYDHSGQYDKALAAYQKAVQILPEFDEAYNNMGFTYARLKMKDQAIAAFRKAHQLRPQQEVYKQNMDRMMGLK